MSMSAKDFIQIAEAIRHFYQGDLTDALRQYKKAHPDAQMGDGILAMAKMVEDSGGNPGEFIAFATHNPIPEALRKYGPTTQE